ncbi:acetylornithine deacetylase [Halopseudomonas aestusnigri]|jgi:acetylornithine deacetylase|uniref:acetylornithine deacetylase n=1 Tax=Halopseudomonas aestusnigri TaxID=857252 RepID=UPI000C943326|nr:acetylornithine deacetylase [Halopseudomonas aestusnigri]MAP77686.1 acetylornithine deacetylase [Pseudomonadales bacterium]UGV31250.1 acetylornithine deacetylase [Halopseudomonas aestusnigri]HBT55988.1 acetylornithine deacetylase [Pseudomonas sp.]|tara:strand:- start:1839 stop:2987 length:1149 start_codon:yes stop_codon:yes gene_type:complete
MPLPPLKDQFDALLRLPSISCTQADLDQSNLPVVELLASWLSDLGFECRILPIANQPGKANLLASFGSGPGGLVMAGHTDTVPCNPERWQHDPFALTEANNRWYGLGSCDMKGFFPLIIEAVRSYLNQPFKHPLIILATADEESSMSGARALVAADFSQARHAIIGEPTGMRPIRLHKGIMMERIDIIGQAGHSSDPGLGHNAMEAMHAVISDLLQLRGSWQKRWSNPLFGVPTPTLNLGCIHGGDNPNRICAKCALEFDIRPLPGMNGDELRAAIRERLLPIAAEHQVQIDYKPLFPGVPAFETPADAPIVRACEELTGQSAGAVAFATEGPYLNQLGMQTLILGPGDIDQAHQPDEFLALDRLQPTIDLLQGLIRRFCLQ